MGNKDSTIINCAPVVVENTEQTHLGPLTLMQSDQTFCFLKIFTFTDNFLMQDKHRKFKTRVNKISENSHVLNVYSVSKMEKKQLCANNYQLHVFLQRPQYSLADMISRRLKDKQNFSEEQLFNFMGKLVASLIYIQDNGLKNIQLDAQAIVFCSERVKVLDCGVACSKTYYQLLEGREKGIQFLCDNIYLAPQLLKELEELNYDPYISPKADIFAIGMLLLEMVTLEPMHGYYDYTCAAIDYDSLIHRLSRINHSLPLKTLIAEMLEYDPEQRIGLLSLKEKIHKIQNPQADQTQIARSKSSKMLKQILSQSRKSGSLSRQGDANSGLSRQPSTQRKNTSRIEMHCSGKKLDLAKQVKIKQPDAKDGESKDEKEVLGKKQSLMINAHLEQNIDQIEFKNLVRNRLVKQKEKNKQNTQVSQEVKKQSSYDRPRLGMNQTRSLRDHNNNRLEALNNSKRIATVINGSREDDLNSNNKFDAASSSKMFDSSIGYSKASLCKLVEESGIKNLLKMEHLSQSALKKSHPESMKNTSRFGNCQPSDFKQKNIGVKAQGFRKISEIYIREEEEASKLVIPLVTARQPVSHQRQLQKVMTFNNKEFLISARSVEKSVEQISPHERLVFSPIATESRENESSQIERSPEAKITIKNIPVVISQQKVYEPNGLHPNFGKLQRNLHLLDCARSIQEDSLSNEGNNNNFKASKVLESFKPRNLEERQRSMSIAGSKVEAYNHENSCFLKKAKSRKPQLNIQLQEDEQQNVNVKSFRYQNNPALQTNQTPYQKMPSTNRPFAKLDYLYRTSQSVEQLSNFTSISPPQDSKDRSSTFQLLFQHKNFSCKKQEGTSNSILNKAVFSNGDSYQGQLSPEGIPHGNGILQSSAGRYRYSGSFINGKFNGYGTLLNLNYRSGSVDYQYIDMSKGYWTRFEGQFENGGKTGFGTIFFQEGEKFSGCLKKDIIEGYGCFYKKSGELISGLWNDNKFKKI